MTTAWAEYRCLTWANTRVGVGLDRPLDRAKIRVHVFYCVLALAVAHLMRRQAHQAGLDPSVRELLTTLAGIQETVLLYPTGNKGRPRAQRILIDTDPTQKRLIKLFEPTKYAPPNAD